MDEICSKCKNNKNQAEFSAYEFKKSGGYCKSCKHIWYKINKLKILGEAKAYYESNKDVILFKQKEYYKGNLESILDYARDYRQSHKEAAADYNRDYRSIHRKKLSFYRRKYEKERRDNDPEYKIKNNISNSVNSFLKKKGSSKNFTSIEKYLLYTIYELKVHLEKQFESWMTWQNWGRYNSQIWDDADSSTWTWQIDHIIPHSKFNYTSMEDQFFKECWALNNLRPLNAKQNVIENNRKSI